MPLFGIPISTRPLFLFIALFVLFLSAGCGDESGGAVDGTSADPDFENVEWGRPVKLDEIVTMVKAGRVREIQWHVMPNVIRVVASDGSFFYFQNENKGVDLRNTLIEAGVRIGKGGIPFRHVF